MLKLFRIAGFFAYIAMMFLNAFVDLGHKIIIQNTVFKTYDGAEQVMLTAVVNGLILLPFVMLFTPAGFIADKFSKPKVMRMSALFAVFLTVLITLFYYLGLFWPAFAMTFLLAVQSAIYSPAKYGYIKELVGKTQLAAANGIVQAVTIVSILGAVFAFSIGFETLLAGHTLENKGEIMRLIAPMGFILIALSVLEVLASFGLAPRSAAAPERPFEVSRYVSGRYLRTNLSAIFENPVIWLSIIGLAMFWGLSQAVLAVFPAFAKEVTGENNTIYIQGAMAGAGIGIMLGSILAGRASSRFIETGLIPIGALGIVISLFTLPLLSSIPAFALNFVALGLFGGLFMIPLNALIQFHAGEGRLGTVIAGNNLIQNIVMLSFLGLTVATSLGGLSMKALFGLLMVIGLVGTGYTLYRLPQSLVRVLLRTAISGRYRIDVPGFKNLPERGPVLMLGNHVSQIDWAMIQIASPRPVRFMMQRDVRENGALQKVMNMFDILDVSQMTPDAIYQVVSSSLKNGEVVCLFPEGSFSRNGQLGHFGGDFARMFEGVEGGKILPFYIGGLWGSRFSGAAARGAGQSAAIKRSVIVEFGTPLSVNEPGVDISGVGIKQHVRDLSISAWQRYAQSLPALPQAIIESLSRSAGALSVADHTGRALSPSRALTGGVLLSSLVGQQQNEARIGLLLPPSIGGVLANMAVLFSGKVVVNLNYTGSAEAIYAAIGKAGLKTILTSKLFLTRLEQRGLKLDSLNTQVSLVFLEDIVANQSAGKKIAVLAAVKLLPTRVLQFFYVRKTDPEQPAIILFSSGSEGMPKGVVLSHRNVMANIKQISHVLDLRDTDVVVASLPLFHAFGLTVTCFMPLVEGVGLIAHPDPTDAQGMGRAVARYNGTILFGTSTLFRLYNRNAKLHPLMFESLRYVVAGAEKLSGPVRNKFREKFTKEIFEGYGATETGPVAAVNVPDQLDTAFWQVQTGDRHGTVGMPLPGSNFRITDPESLEELGVGEDGMIFIGGPQVMLGYLDDPERTKDVIFEVDGTRWYKTGDKGRLDADGFLSITDRFSRFAKIGGEMISLGAVEEQVRSVLADPDVDLVAVNIPCPRKGEKVVLLLAECHRDLRPELKAKLSAAGINPLMIPTDVEVMAEVPKLGSGKTDFKTAKLILLSGREK